MKRFRRSQEHKDRIYDYKFARSRGMTNYKPTKTFSGGLWLCFIGLVFWALISNLANADPVWITTSKGVREYRLEHGKVYNKQGKCLYKYNNGKNKVYNCNGKFLFKYTGDITQILGNK